MQRHPTQPTLLNTDKVPRQQSELASTIYSYPQKVHWYLQSSVGPMFHSQTAISSIVIFSLFSPRKVQKRLLSPRQRSQRIVATKKIKNFRRTKKPPSLKGVPNQKKSAWVRLEKHGKNTAVKASLRTGLEKDWLQQWPSHEPNYPSVSSEPFWLSAKIHWLRNEAEETGEDASHSERFDMRL